jgi:hypothetical protein
MNTAQWCALSEIDTKFDRLGVAIKSVGPNQRHIGIVYRLRNARPRIVHLAWHYQLLDEECSKQDGYIWSESYLDDVNKQLIARFVADVGANCASVIPYGVRSERTVFDQNAQFVSQPVGYGMTCATFVLRIFEQLGYPLLQESTWPLRTEDAHWLYKVVIPALRDPTAKVDPGHVNAMENSAQSPRFRPEEVAAAVPSEQAPLGFDQAAALARELIDLIKDCRLFDQMNASLPQ